MIWFHKKNVKIPHWIAYTASKTRCLKFLSGFVWCILNVLSSLSAIFKWISVTKLHAWAALWCYFLQLKTGPGFSTERSRKVLLTFKYIKKIWALSSLEFSVSDWCSFHVAVIGLSFKKQNYLDSPYRGYLEHPNMAKTLFLRPFVRSTQNV